MSLLGRSDVDDEGGGGALFPQAECVSLFAPLQISIKMLSGQTIKAFWLQLTKLLGE